MLFPWTSGVVALVFFLIGALAVRKTSIRRVAGGAGSLWLLAVIVAALLARTAKNCS